MTVTDFPGARWPLWPHDSDTSHSSLWSHDLEDPTVHSYPISAEATSGIPAVTVACIPNSIELVLPHETLFFLVTELLKVQSSSSLELFVNTAWSNATPPIPWLA